MRIEFEPEAINSATNALIAKQAVQIELLTTMVGQQAARITELESRQMEGGKKADD